MLVPVDNGEALPGLLQPRSYVLPDGLSYERWASIGASLQQIRDSINFWIGDWLIYGERHFGEDAYAAVRDDIKAIFGRGEESIDQAILVARSYPPDTRVPELKWSHHREALRRELPIEESIALLQTAREERLPTRMVARRADEMVAAIKLDAPAPNCAADAPWTPTLDDLEPDWRPHVEAEARSSDEFIRGVLWAWRIAGNESMFREDRWRDG